MTTSLNTNRFDALLRRVGDLKGPGSKVNEVISELFPMVDVENVPHELLLLAGWKTCWGTIQVDPGGSLAQAMITNPPQSGQLVVLTKVTHETQGNQEGVFIMGPATSNFTTGTRGFFRDTRLGQNRESTAVLTQQPLSVIPNAFRKRYPADGFFELVDTNGIIVLQPGTALVVQDSSTNDQFIVNFLWRERVALPSELTI